MRINVRPNTVGGAISISTPERQFCDAARDYLLSFRSEGVTSEVLDYYLYLSEQPRKLTINQVYEQLLWSAQNANMKASVVSGSMPGGVTALSGVLQGFDPRAVCLRYGDDWQTLLTTIVETIAPRGRVRRGPNSIWPRYCRSALSGAAFLSRFEEASDFYAWADEFDRDDGRRIELPSQIRREVFGLGFALSCDFLKELGYSSFGKPDVHIRKILGDLGLMHERATDPEALAVLWSFSSAAGYSPYYVDKLMWLLSTGKLYRHSDIDTVRTDRDGFVRSQQQLFASSA